MFTGSLSRGRIGLGLKLSSHLLLPSVKYKWSYTSISPLCLLGKLRDRVLNLNFSPSLEGTQIPGGRSLKPLNFVRWRFRYISFQFETWLCQSSSAWNFEIITIFGGKFVDICVNLRIKYI